MPSDSMAGPTEGRDADTGRMLSTYAGGLMSEAEPDTAALLEEEGVDDPDRLLQEPRRRVPRGAPRRALDPEAKR